MTMTASIKRRKSPMSRRIKALALFAVVSVSGGCSIFDPDGRPVIRTLMIHRHHFDPPQLTVPANTPFDLVVSAQDMSSLTISSPPLGFTSTSVPATWRSEFSVRPPTPADFKKVRIPIGPMSNGVYEISCDCHGEHPIGRLIVK